MKLSNNSIKEKLTNYQPLIAYTLILFGIITRFLPHPANFTPLAALALFGGTYLNRKNALIIPIIAMLISDYFLGFHSTMPYVYGSFILIVCIGFWLQKHPSIWTTIGASLAGSFLFFLITNFGSWLHFNMYPHTWAGLIQCYVMGIPFYRNTLLGDLTYTGVFFGLYTVASYIMERRLVWQKTLN